MKSSGIWAGVMLGLSVAGLAVAADETAATRPKKEFSEKQLAQQQRMKDCSAESKEKALKGDDRKAFMKTCLSGGSVTAAAGSETASAPDEKRTAQRQKRKACNADAKSQSLTGDTRKEFMKSCLAK